MNRNKRPHPKQVLDVVFCSSN